MASEDVLVEVEVIQPYKDIEKMMLFYPGEKHTVTKKRASTLIKRGLVKQNETKNEKEPE